MKAVSKEPADRYQNLFEMVEDLQAYLRNDVVKAHTYSVWERFINWEHRHVMLTVAIGSALFGSVLTALLLAVAN